ncbi:hypothetical protein BGX33_012337 [Mortierella sp. NVP41]|nr:hypothetical protein BGX33_012337 [Mortierella sp. NVP41]
MPPKLTAFKNHGIREPLTNRIKGILDEYPDGTQIARELLQNSDDARSTVQWYLLDHHDYNKKRQPSATTTSKYPGKKQSADTSIDTDAPPLRLFHNGLREYMGPALLAGSDSVFEEKDFVSLKNLAASEKRTDESKIGQMGIGFNSIYHLTDCPSFITGDQFMVIEPHERIFNGVDSEFNEGAVRGSFTHGNEGLNDFPDQLKSFSVVEDIDFSKPYDGTIFRFPLRTDEQAEVSDLSKYAYTPAKVLEMLVKLKDEALKALLFLKHVERIVIYERKGNQDKPTKLFEIEIVNAEEVRNERLRLLSNLKSHVYPDDSASREDVLTYSVRPTYRITQEDGSTTEETWHITTLVGNVVKSREYMKARTDGNIASHKLIPWVGIAAPTDPDVKIDTSRLFCFLPIGIQLPFPVHVNGHFAVKQSRREIWTNQDNDFSSQASANIKSLWNVHLFEKQIPEAYAMFLENVGLDHGANYDLWPIHCGEGIGLDAVWKELLKNVLKLVLTQDRKVFVCGSKAKDSKCTRRLSTLYIAGRDIDQFPLLKESLHSMVNMAEDVPDVILREIAELIKALGLDQAILTPELVRDILFDNKERWSSSADPATRIEMVQYCLLDNNIAALEGLPLLPLDGDIWVDFAQDKADERFFVPRIVFEALSQANADLVDLNVHGFPFDQIEAAFKDIQFWSPMQPSSIAKRIRWSYHSNCYQDGVVPAGCISQTPEQFPSDEWILDFWDMAHSLSECRDLFSGLAGIHLLPVGGVQLAPLSTERRVVHVNRFGSGDVSIKVKASSILEQYLGCSVLRQWFRHPGTLLQQFVVDISNVLEILDILSTTTDDDFGALSQADRERLADYLTEFMQPAAKLKKKSQRSVLRRLPVYKGYDGVGWMPLETLKTSSSSTTTTKAKEWRLAQGFNNSEHPWLPQSVDLLAHDQPMKEHLRVMLKIPVLSEPDYWYLLLTHLSDHDQSEWDAIMSKLAPAYHAHSKVIDLASVLRKLPFVSTKPAPESTHNDAFSLSSLLRDLPPVSPEEAPVPAKEDPEPAPPSLPPPRRLNPESVVHPTLAAYFQDKDVVFPAGIYAEAPLFGILSELGMHSTFDSAFVEERFKTLFGSGTLEMDGSRKLVEVLYGRLNSECSRTFLSPELCTVLKTVPWVYTGPESGWLTPTDCRPESDRALVGSMMPLAEFTFTNEALLDCMGWRSPPPLGTVLDNLLSIIKRHTHQDSAESTPASSPGGSPQQRQEQADINTHDILPIYRYLAENVKDAEALVDIKERLRKRPWILVSGAFYTVDRVALKMHCDLQPHFVQVPATNLDNLYLALGVREHVHQEDMEGILATVGSRYTDGEPISKSDADLVYRLLTGIAYGQDPKWSADLLILTEDGALRRAADVVYDDVNVRQSDLGTDDLPYIFAHRRISHEMAERLHIAMFSARCWEDTKDNSFDPFFQQENIVDRIKGILNDYDPSSIFNEFLQNAADAGATECHFQLDTRSFEKTKVLSKDMAAWQGPALLIYNNAEFSDKDFEALCKLGVGNKGEDTSKIGRHGLGFNSVYHFTDVPSVVSGPYIGFFDPHMTNLPKSRDRSGAPIAKGGHRCDFRKLSTETLADQLEPYKGLFGCDMKSHFRGTLFRLPLRLKGSQALLQSGFKDEGWTLVQVQKLLEDWIADAKLGLLFLKGMRSIHISDGFKPQITLTKTDTSLTTNLARRLLTTEITIESLDSEPTTTKSTKWLVCSDCTFPFGTPEEVRRIAAKHHWSPHCGVALPLGGEEQLDSLEGRLLVYLPTPILTGLPFHIHGGFALTSNRKSLAGGQEKENDKHIWNNFLLERCLPETALLAFEQLLKHMFRNPSFGGPGVKDLQRVTRSYFQHWPVKSCKEFELFLDKFIYMSNTRWVFPVRGASKEILVTGTAGSAVTMPGGVKIPQDLKERIYKWLRQGSVPLSVVPSAIRQLLKASWKGSMFVGFHEIDGDLIRKRLRADPGFISQQMKTPEEREWIMEVVLKPLLDPTTIVKEPLLGLAIVPLRNGEWKSLQSSATYYHAGSTIEALIDAKDILVDSDLFCTKDLKPILDALITSPVYGVHTIEWSILVSRFISENPGGVSDDKWKSMWEFLAKVTNITPAEDLPVLKTSYRTMTTIKAAKYGLQITGVEPATLNVVHTLMDLFRDLGIVVFDAAKHKNHQYFKVSAQPYSNIRVVSLIADHWRPSVSRPLSNDEASRLRLIVVNNPDKIDNALAAKLGALPIWHAYGNQSAHTGPLIAAAGARYLEGHFQMADLGELPTLISYHQNYKHFRAMGATPLKIAEALMDVALPKFLSGELKCEGEAKVAYLHLFNNLLSLSARRGNISNVPKETLLIGRCYLARDGSFHTLSELIQPQPLTNTIFADRRDLFPDYSLSSAVSHQQSIVCFRSLESDPRLVQECAEKVLAETTNPNANPETTRARAVLLVKYIYNNPAAGGVDWMDAKWRFVPREVNLEPPYNEMAPDLPLYMSFLSLYNPQNRDATWTQLGYFPADLLPSAAFKAKYPNVFTYYIVDELQHLNTLVKRIAPKWKTTEQQLALKALLFKIYKDLEDFTTRNDECRQYIVTVISKFMKAPYVLNGNDKDPSKANSWVWPAQLMFDIDHSIVSHQVVDPILHQYRTFLVAAGAEEMVHVEGTVKVADGRKLGDIEIQIMNCFETQDQETGFMDVRFKFQEGSDILAHKVVLARASEYFFRRFTGVWASNSTRDPEEPGVEIIDLSGYGDIKTGFWGLLYYFYSDTLIQSNGPPLFDSEQEDSTDREEEGSGASGQEENEDEDEGSEGQALEDRLSERVQYLMGLQEVANRFEAARLKDLIAQELIMGQKVIHSNVFSIRGHAEHSQADNVREYCDKFIAKNKSSVIKYVEGEIEAVRNLLASFDRTEAQEDEEDDEDYVPSSDDDEPTGDTESEDEVDEGDGASAIISKSNVESETEEPDYGAEGLSDLTDGDRRDDGSNDNESVERGAESKGEDDEPEEDSIEGEENSESVEGQEGSDETDDDWDYTSAVATSEEDDSVSEDEGDDGDDDDRIDAIAYLNSISPARALVEEELRALEENLEELLAL